MAEVVLNYLPRAQFKPFHARRQRFACIVAHRRAGKTVACVRDLERAALRNNRSSPAPRYAYIAPLFRQARDNAWAYFKEGAREIPGTKINEADSAITYPNGAMCRIYGGDNPDSLRGTYLDGVVLDEYADMRPDLYPEVISPQLSDYRGWATFIGTPKGRDAFHAVWVKACENPEDWYTLIVRGSESGLLPQEELDRNREDKSESQYNREIECSFDEPDVAQFISGQDVNLARQRKSWANGPKLIGVDIARFGDDRTVIVYRNGDVLEEINTFRGLDTMQVVDQVISAMAKYRPDQTFIDESNMGAGVVDRLKQLRYSVMGVNAGSSSTDSSRFKNLRAEMWDKMRKWIKDRGSIPMREDLANDLCSLTYRMDHRNSLQLESKDDLKKRGLSSPDIADALAMTFAAPVAFGELRARDRVDGAAEAWNPLDTRSGRTSQQDWRLAGWR